MESPLFRSCYLTLFFMFIRNSESQPAMVHTSSGAIQGSVVSIGGRNVHEYLGILYAEPPIGNLRFKRPKPIEPWRRRENITNKMPPACIQYSKYPFPWYDFEDNLSENCLYLNIWAPERKGSEAKKSVMFWIHGGGYVYGSIRKPVYNGKALAAEGDVIVVTVNYRLGAFGFFTTNTDAAPVNNALFDMLEALKWVNKNIGAFGGDPNQVTLFGESAGSWSVGFFCVSPLTKGLFKRVIMESGSPASIQFDLNTTSLLISQKLALDLGCTDLLTSPDEVADCMREKDPIEIAKTLNSYDPNFGESYLPVYGNEFLPENGRENLKSGKFHDVSVLIGNNRDEGSIVLTLASPETFGFFGDKLPSLNTSKIKALLQATHVFKDSPGADLATQTILESVKGDDYRKNLKIIYDIVGDFTVVCPDVYFAESYSQYGKKVYFYFFKHRPSTTPWAEWMGAAHYEEVQFVFGSPLIENKYTEEEVELSKLMIKMWSNFAKYGDPLHDESKQRSPRAGALLQNDLRLEKWPIYSRETPMYLILDKTTLKAKRYALGPHKTNCDLFRPINGFL